MPQTPPQPTAEQFKALVEQMTAESRQRTDTYLNSFENALPGMPISDELKEEFTKAAAAMQLKLEWGPDKSK